VKHVRLIVAASIALVAITGYAAFKLTPWPSVWLIRHAYHDHASKANASLAPLVPGRVSATYDLSYSRGEGDASFDVFAPADATRPLPVVVWVHGGGYVAGSRSDLSNYLQILAARGFVTVAIDYSLAPGARFPTPVKQTNQALAYLSAHADELHIDSRRFFLAGDSAGAQIAAQTALVISDSSYAKSLGVDAGISRSTLRGIVLYCGPYDPTFMTSEGMLADFKRTVLLSYMGTRDPNDPRAGGDRGDAAPVLQLPARFHLRWQRRSARAAIPRPGPDPGGARRPGRHAVLREPYSAASPRVSGVAHHGRRAARARTLGGVSHGKHVIDGHPQSFSGQLKSTGTILAMPPGYPNGTAETRVLWRRDAVFPPFGGDGDRIIAHASADSDKRVVRSDTRLSPPVDPSRGC
jgi:acetyl esterase/lipase